MIIKLAYIKTEAHPYCMRAKEALKKCRTYDKVRHYVYTNSVAQWCRPNGYGDVEGTISI